LSSSGGLDCPLFSHIAFRACRRIPHQYSIPSVIPSCLLLGCRGEINEEDLSPSTMLEEEGEEEAANSQQPLLNACRGDARLPRTIEL